MTGRMPIRSGTFRVPLPGEPGHYGLSPWEYTLADLLSDAGYATACFGKWHLGNVQGRIPTDQGFDEWWGISESSDEADYTSHPMYPPDFPRPKIKASLKGQPVEEVDDFNLRTRPLMDENIADKTVDFIKRNAEADTPFGAGDLGTPGAANDCVAPAPDLVINEIIQNPSAVFDSNGEWFEIYNNSASAIAMPTAVMIPWPSGPVVVSTPAVSPCSGCPGVRLSHWRKSLISSSGRS